jgi:hypothetical protein
MSDVSIALGGFGSQGWGTAAWGEGNVSFVAYGEIEGPAIDAGSDIGVTSVNGIGQVGTVFVFTDIDVLVTGVAGTVSVGSVSVNGAANTPVTGLQAVGSVGSVTVVPQVDVFVVGVSCTASITSVSVWITINDNQTPNWVEIAA